MIKRADLEIPRTPEEMGEFISTYERDVNAYSNEDVHLRKGTKGRVLKAFLEEYCPLYTLVLNLPNVRTARLTPKSNQGPDAIVSTHEKELTVQITRADESSKRALQRELLSKGRPVFPTCNIIRNKKTRETQQSGRVLTTRKARLQQHVDNIVSAIQRKCQNFREGTDALLVATRMGPSALYSGFSWGEELRNRITFIASLPYMALYVANGEQLIVLKE
jgi:hypothetical protein